MTTKSTKSAIKRGVETWRAGLVKALEKDPRSINKVAEEAGVGATSLREWRDGKATPRLDGAIAVRTVLSENWPKRWDGRVL